MRYLTPFVCVLLLLIVLVLAFSVAANYSP